MGSDRLVRGKGENVADFVVPTRPAEVLLCSADEIIARRVSAIIEESGHEVLATLERLDELLDAVRAIDPTLIVLVHEFEPFGSTDDLRALREEIASVPLVLVPCGFVGAGVRKLARTAVEGLVLETEIEQALGPTIDAVAAEQLCLPASLRDELARPVFSHREKQVLELVVQGLTNGEIASRLYLSESTVKSHLASSFRKLGVSSRAEVTRRVLSLNGGFERSSLKAPDLASLIDG